MPPVKTSAPTPRLTLAAKLRTEMARRDLGVRGLAKIVDPTNPEQARRSIRRWVKGTHMPTQPSLDRLTDALGMERGSLNPDDDEEADPAMARAERKLVQATRDRDFVEATLQLAAIARLGKRVRQ